MKGVIDLFFLHDGKYYFINWKSNWLGSSSDDYKVDALKDVMKEHDYYLQAEIYKEALNKFLNIVETREFEDCFGGIFYIFLRGIDLTTPECGVFHFKALI